MYSTPKQIALIDNLAAQRGQSTIAVVEEYGLGLKAARDLTKHDASEMIDWLLNKPIPSINRNSEAYKAAKAKAEADNAEFDRKFGSK